MPGEARSVVRIAISRRRINAGAHFVAQVCRFVSNTSPNYWRQVPGTPAAAGLEFRSSRLEENCRRHDVDFLRCREAQATAACRHTAPFKSTPSRFLGERMSSGRCMRLCRRVSGDRSFTYDGRNASVHDKIHFAMNSVRVYYEEHLFIFCVLMPKTFRR